MLTNAATQDIFKKFQQKWKTSRILEALSITRKLYNSAEAVVQGSVHVQCSEFFQASAHSNIALPSPEMMNGTKKMCMDYPDIKKG